MTLMRCRANAMIVHIGNNAKNRMYAQMQFLQAKGEDKMERIFWSVLSVYVFAILLWMVGLCFGIK